MSIFQKDCPQCATPNAAHATRCKCGYYFEAAGAESRQAATEVALQEEALYQDYLAARLVQAEAELEVARGNAAVDPGNTYKAAEVLVAEQALSALRAELRVQSQRTAELKKISHRPSRAVNPETRTTPAVVPLLKIKSAAIPKPAAKPAPIIAVAKPETVRPKLFQPKPETATSKREIVQPKKPSAPVAKPSEVPVKPAMLAKSVTPAKKPGAKFRSRQAAKAEAAVRAARAVQRPVPAVIAAPPARPAPPAAAKPAAPVNASTVAKNEIVETTAATKDCPNCTATVAADVGRCRCGFGFVSASFEMPSLSLDAGATAILANDTTGSGKERRG